MPVKHAPQKPRSIGQVSVIGWMEYVTLPELHIDPIKAKIDTGARTTALHATDIEAFEKGGKPWVRFRVVDEHNAPGPLREAPVHEERAIKNTSGVPEDRYVIRTKARFGAKTWVIDLSLADRTNMTFPMIVGRTALKNHAIAVHTKRAFLLSARTDQRRRKDTK
ncbi:ATP-dependent zinc protease family protein [Pseudoprimorskyibacter insulae]|uniref:Retropepsin-like aspartic endopeptidase domain-containing protein n=1 Tax=Pseudoprimorskyibacter insulae TaxID=1695997 RepID=A0A2R8B073_9RHOB|nr:RimK/LysX family protein [Pseudoprimorskyibacter insulae]SPF81671.1 hypothetical protein PRI8871_03496 [Pseudoprimorskyibacter insulae]